MVSLGKSGDAFPEGMARLRDALQRDAWKVVEELRNRGITISVKSREDLDPTKDNCDELIQLKDMKYAVQSWDKDLNRYSPSVYGKTAEEAICNAALKLGVTAGADENEGS